MISNRENSGAWLADLKPYGVKSEKRVVPWNLEFGLRILDRQNTFTPEDRVRRACEAASRAYNGRMPFAITAVREFSAAHQLRLYDGSLEPLHGHNWRVAVTVMTDRLDQIGVVMDFHELERMLDAIVMPLHNAHLNEVSPFQQELNPSTENVAYHVGRSLELPMTVRLASVEVWETSGCSAVYRP